MKARGVGMALLAVLAGCTTSKELYLPDGSRGHSISCEGFASSMENCYQKAGEICAAKGYDIASPQGVIGTRSLFIRCKP